MAEATYRLIQGLDLKKSNIACIFVTTGFPKNSSSFFRPTNAPTVSVDDLNNEEHPKIDEVNIGPSVTLEGRQGEFKEVQTIHQKYSERPESLKNVCLAQFATSYAYIKSVPKDTEWVNNHSVVNGVLSEFGSKNKLLPKYIRLDSGVIWHSEQNL